jgi:intein/homing endonuclease
MTLIPYYFHREKEIFIKPTTTKNVLKFFEITHITYTPKPNYTFYKEYKKIITHMKQEVPTIPKDSAAFTGFLMMGIEMLKES